jgi:hypothetical protein
VAGLGAGASFFGAGASFLGAAGTGETAALGAAFLGAGEAAGFGLGEAACGPSRAAAALLTAA